MTDPNDSKMTLIQIVKKCINCKNIIHKIINRESLEYFIPLIAFILLNIIIII